MGAWRGVWRGGERTLALVGGVGLRGGELIRGTVVWVVLVLVLVLVGVVCVCACAGVGRGREAGIAHRVLHLLLKLVLRRTPSEDRRAAAGAGCWHARERLAARILHPHVAL